MDVNIDRSIKTWIERIYIYLARVVTSGNRGKWKLYKGMFKCN